MNREASCDRLRRLASEIFQAGLAAADPHRAVFEALETTAAGRPVIAGRELAADATLRVVSVGKAGVTMARAVADRISSEVFPGSGVVVVNRENHHPLERFRVFAAGHPYPDTAGVAAAHAVERYVAGCRPEDALLVLISGGGSALLPSPAPGVSLEDKIQTTRLLLASGAPIQEVNAVRKHLSTLKGGGLARLAQPARVESLILSDVIGDDLATIASGPTAPDPTTFADVAEILKRHEIADAVPPAVRRRIERGIRGEIADTPGSDDPLFERVSHRLVGSNGRSLEAARRRAAELGLEPWILSGALIGQAREAARFVRKQIAECPVDRRPVAILAGGETTVTLRGSGRGGRNQEMALAFALECEVDPLIGFWVFLSGGTDGRDGPTEAAGGLVDGETIRRIRVAGLDPVALLDDNDSYRALSVAGDLLQTGPTGTNVADLQVLLLDSRIGETLA